MLSDAEKQLRREEIARESKFFTEEAALKELNRKLRPGEVPNINSIRQYIRGLFFDRRKYDLSRVGRYKFNKKLALSARIANTFAFDDIVDTSTGEIIVAKGDYISEETAVRIQNLGINEVAIEEDGAPEGKHIVIGNAHVSLAGYIDCDPKELGITEMVYYPILKTLIDKANGDMQQLKQLIVENEALLVVKHLLINDVIATLKLYHGIKI